MGDAGVTGPRNEIDIFTTRKTGVFRPETQTAAFPSWCHCVYASSPSVVFSDPDVSPAEVAAEAGISVRYLQKLFAARAITFGHFIRSLRLDHAAQLLRQQTSIKATLPLTEVAYACGYRDYAHFARNFRARFGCAPGASRGWISSGATAQS